MLNGTEHSNQGPNRMLNGMECSVRGVQGSNLGTELNFFHHYPHCPCHPLTHATCLIHNVYDATAFLLVCITTSMPIPC